MRKLPRITPDEIIRVLEKKGFRLSRQSGSHRIYKNEEGKRVTVPYHKGRILHEYIKCSFKNFWSLNFLQALLCRGRDLNPHGDNPNGF